MDDDETARALLGRLDAAPSTMRFTPDGLPDGPMGKEVARLFLTQLADRVDEDGWDQPDSIWALRTPAATIVDMKASGIETPADAYVLGLVHIGYYRGSYLGYLPLVPPVDPGMAAVILVTEGWFSPSGQAPPSRASDRVDVRTLTLLPKTGDAYSLQIVRGGQVSFSGDPGEGAIRGPLVAVLGHWLGRQPPKSQFTAPALFGHLVWQHVALGVARAAGAFEGEGVSGEVADQALTTVAARIMVGVATQCATPFVDGLNLECSDADLAALRECADADQAILDAEVAARGLTVAHAVAREITLVQAVASHPDLLPERATRELAEWAGESLLGALLTGRLLEDTERWRGVVRSVSPEVAQTTAGVLGRLGWDGGTEIDARDVLWGAC